MKVNERQLLVLLRVLEGTLRFKDGGNNPFVFDYATREKTYKDVMNQTSEMLVEVTPDEL